MIRAHIEADYNEDNSYDDINDDSGHGTYITSIILNHDNNAPDYQGIAPEADLVAVRAFDENGRGTYLDVIAGIDWIVANKDAYDIRILNLSFAAAPQSHY